MKTISLAALAALFSIGAWAQTPRRTADKRHDMKDLRKDTREVRHDKSLRNYELKHHDYAEARHQTRDIRKDLRSRRSDVKDLKRDGVKHPQIRADRQIHRQNFRRKG